MWGSREMRARCDPLLVGLESKAELLVEDPQVSVATTSHRLRRNLLHLVRHDTDIGLLAVVVAETIEVQAIGKPAEQHDVVLQGDVRPPSASTAATPSAAATATRTPATGADARTTATAAGHPRSSPASAHALAAAIGLGAIVEIEDEQGEKMEIEISSVGGVSTDSPLGGALIGAKAGDTVEVKAPKGAWKARVVSVRSA